MADPGKNGDKIKIEHRNRKIIFGPQQNNIIPFPSFITNKTKQKRNGNKTHTHTQTYRLRRRMADPGKLKLKDMKRNKIKIEHRQLEN